MFFKLLYICKVVILAKILIPLFKLCKWINFFNESDKIWYDKYLDEIEGYFFEISYLVKDDLMIFKRNLKNIFRLTFIFIFKLKGTINNNFITILYENISNMIMIIKHREIKNATESLSYLKSYKDGWDYCQSYCKKSIVLIRTNWAIFKRFF